MLPAIFIFLFLVPLAHAEDNCPVLNTSGSYVQTFDYTGAPNPTGSYLTCVYITASDVQFDCGGHLITNDGPPGNTTGIFVDSLLSNVTIRNCNVSGYQQGIDLGSGFNYTVTNNTAHNNTDYGFLAVNSGLGPANHTFRWNTGYNNTMSFVLFLSSNNTFRDNVAYNSGTGFFAFNGTNNTYDNCTSHDNSFAGYLFQWSTNNTFSNSAVYNNPGGGFYIDTGSDGNLLVNNTAFNQTSSAGFILHQCSYNTYVNNTAYSNAYGFGGGSTNFTGNTFINNTARNNGYGLYFEGYNRTTLSGNSVHDNTNNGVVISNSNLTKITGDHYYNNAVGVGHDFVISDPVRGGIVNLSGVVFDNPSGDFRNYTNVSLNDTVYAGEGYSFDWSAQPAALNYGYSSVNDTFVSIKQQMGSVSIDVVVWQWNDSLIGGHNESRFQLWRHNPSDSRPWRKINAALDTAANTLTVTGLNPASVYAILEAGDCRDEDSDGAPYPYVPGSCVNVTEDCDDTDPYHVPPYAGLALTDNDMTYTLCPGTYPISTPPGNPILMSIGGLNTTLECNGTSIINDRNGIAVYGSNSMATVRNCVFSECMYGAYFGWGYQASIHDNEITNCTYGVHTESAQYAGIHDNVITGAAYGMTLRNAYNSSIYGNDVNSSIYGYSASNQYLNYSGAIFDDSRGVTTFVPSDIFSSGGQPCEVSGTSGSIAACPAFNGTQDLSVVLNDLSTLGFGMNATILINEQFSDCAQVDAWWDSNIGMHPQCYFACVLYTANGAGNDYTLNESCYSATVNVSGGLAYPPYVDYGPATAYGVQLTHSSGNLIYNNAFATTAPVSDSDNGYFQDFFASFSPFTLNGQEYNGSFYTYQSPHTLFLHNVNNGQMGGSDWVGSDDTVLNAADTDGTHSYGLFLANISWGGGPSQYISVYFDTANLAWASCGNVESALYNQLRPGDCHAFCQNILTANGSGQNYSFDPSCINSTFNVTSGYTYPPYIHYLNYSVPLNLWNTTKQLGPNIIGGAYIGGNFYSDYNGTDSDGDGIGDVPPYYNITGPSGSVSALDNLPLTNNVTPFGCTNLSNPSSYGPNVTKVNDTYELNGSVALCRDNYTQAANATMVLLTVSNITFDCNGSTLMGPGVDTTMAGIAAYSQEGLNITNCSITNFSRAVELYNVNYSSVSYGDFFNNTNNALGELDGTLYVLFSNGNDFFNNTVTRSGFMGVALLASSNNTFTDNAIVNNSVASMFVIPFSASDCNNTMVNNAGGYYGKPINYTHDADGITYENVANDYSEIIWCDVMNSVMRNVSISNGPGRMDGMLVIASSGNNLSNISSSDNFLGVYLGGGSSGNSLANSSFTGNAFRGLFVENAVGNNFSYNEIASNGIDGIVLSSNSENNVFRGNVVHGNAYVPAGQNYEIAFEVFAPDDYPRSNLFYDTLIYNATRYVGFTAAAPGNASNFTNLTACYNGTIGCVSWDFLSLTNASLVNGTNIILDPGFVSLNSSDAGAVQFNSSANMTVDSGSTGCSLNYYKASGFPQSRVSVLSGSLVSPAYTQCSAGITTFSTVGAFSGYAASEAAQNCTDISSPGSYSLTSDVSGAASGGLNPGEHSCILITSSDVIFDCAGHRVSNNGTGGTTYGILFSGSLTNVTIENCRVSGYSSGVFVHDSNASMVRNNSASGGSYGIVLDPSYNNTLIGNSVYNNTVVGLLLEDSHNNTLRNNTAYNNTLFGIELNSSSTQNLLYNNTAADNGNSGIYILSSDDNNLTDNIASGHAITGILVSESDGNVVSHNEAYNNSNGFYLLSSTGTNLTSDNAHNNSNGILLDGSTGNRLFDCTSWGNNVYGYFAFGSSNNNLFESGNAHDNGFSGFYLLNSQYNTLSGQISFMNGGDGFRLLYADNNAMAGGTAYNNSGYGFTINSSSYNNVSVSESYNNTGSGFRLEGGSSNNRFSSNLVAYNQEHGFDLNNASGNYFLGNSVYGNAVVGMLSAESSSGNLLSGNDAYGNLAGFAIINGADSNNLTSNTVHGNSLAALYIENSTSTLIAGDHYYDHPLADFYVNNTDPSATMAINLSGVAFDNPSGGYSQYTNLSLSDSVPPSSEYDITWSQLPGTLPTNTTSFAQKFINITAVRGTVSLDTVVWHWTDAEAAPYDKTKFRLWKYNSSGGWENLSATLDTVANTLTIANLNPASGYGPLQDGNATVNLTAINLYGANVTNVTALPRYDANLSGNVSTEGGNISEVNVSTVALTDRWAAFFGNITGAIVLRDADPGEVYHWDWTPVDGGVVCASTNQSLSSLMAGGALGSDIDNAWGFGSVTDSGANTFNITNCTLYFSGTPVGGADAADTGQPGGFETCAFKTVLAPSKPQMLFCVNITAGGILWNGGTGDFEMILPTAFGPSVTETYYMYANLD